MPFLITAFPFQNSSILKLFQISLNRPVCCTNHHSHFSICNLRIILNSIDQSGCCFTFLLVISFKKSLGLWRQFYCDIFYDIFYDISLSLTWFIAFAISSFDNVRISAAVCVRTRYSFPAMAHCASYVIALSAIIGADGFNFTPSVSST